jgi:hypothetical protein
MFRNNPTSSEVVSLSASAGSALKADSSPSAQNDMFLGFASLEAVENIKKGG